MPITRLPAILRYATGALLCALLAISFVWFWLGPVDLEAPISLQGDSPANMLYTENVQSGGGRFESEQYGYPFGADFDYFPLRGQAWSAHNHVLALFTNDVMVQHNLFIITGFGLFAALAYVVFLRLGGQPMLALLFGFAVTFCEFNLLRGVVHHGLFPPYYALLLPLLIHELGRFLEQPYSRLSPRYMLALAVAVGTAVGLTDLYAIFFFGVCFSVAMTLLWARSGEGLTILWLTVAAFAGLLGGIAVSLWPVWAANPGLAESMAQRTAAMQVRSGLRIADLVIPVYSSIPPVLDAIREYAGQRLPGSGRYSFIGYAGVLGLGIVAAVLLGGRRLLQYLRLRGSAETTLVVFAGLLLFILVFFSAHGLGYLFNLIITDGFRGHNRIVPLVAVLATSALLLVLTQRESSGKRRGPIRRWLPLVAGLFLAGSVFDHAAPNRYQKLQSSTIAEFAEHQRFFAAFESRVKPGSVIYQAPFFPFPEGGRKAQAESDESAIPALLTDGYRWSYGVRRMSGMTNWFQALSRNPLELRLSQLLAAGFDGILLDRWAYADNAAAAIQSLHAAGLEPAVVQGERFSYYALPDLFQAGASAKLQPRAPAVFSIARNPKVVRTRSAWSFRFVSCPSGPVVVTAINRNEKAVLIRVVVQGRSSAAVQMDLDGAVASLPSEFQLDSGASELKLRFACEPGTELAMNLDFHDVEFNQQAGVARQLFGPALR